jgi:hypothetical protein
MHNERFEKSLDKGAYGERIVKDLLMSKGYFVYSVENKGSHPFDILLVNNNTKKIMIVDVKSTTRRNKYPDVGIDLDDWKKYKYWKKKTGLDFYIIFVDEMTCEIYGNELRKLDLRKYDPNVGKVYPLPYVWDPYNQLIYFHLDNMDKYGKITEQEALDLRSLSQRYHGYDHSFF